MALAISSDGRIILAEEGGRVWMLTDADNDGLAHAPLLFARSEAGITGLTVLDDDCLYLNEVSRLSLAEDQDGDGVADAVTPLLRGLPSSVHSTNGIVVAPSGRVLVALGSTCNDCRESNALAPPSWRSSRIRATSRSTPPVWATRAAWPSMRMGRSGPPTLAPLRPVRVRTNSTRSVPKSTTAGPTAQTERPRFASQVAGVPLGVDAGAAGLTWFDSPVFPVEFRGGFHRLQRRKRLRPRCR